MGDGVFSRIAAWAQQPFKSEMDLGGWVLFVGLIIILAFAWTRVLNHIVE